jgi:Na+-driven multidrug efflux pump
LGVYFLRLEKYVSFDSALWRPRLIVWGRLLRVGLPAGGEFALMFVFMGVMYSVTRRFGADAQAGFGVGMRVMQCLFLPAMAVSFATAPIVGQNFGAGKFARVRETFAIAALTGGVIMAALSALAQWRAGSLVHFFTSDPLAQSVGAQFLHICSWNFIATGLVFTCSGVFQGLGNTMPAVISSATRLLSFVIPVQWLATQPDFQIVQIWYVSVASVTVQALISLWLVRSEFRKRLNPRQDAAPVPAGAIADG